MGNPRPGMLIIESSVAFTGAIKAALEQARLLSAVYDFVFVVPVGSKAIATIKQAGFKVFELPMIEIGRSAKKILTYLPGLMQNYFRLKKIIKNEDISIVQSNDFYNLLGAVIKLFGYKGKLVTYVRLLPANLPRPLVKLWLGMAQKYADRIVAVSNAVKEQLPVNSKTVLIYDPVQFQISHPPKNWIREDKNIQLLYLANFTRGKGQEHALKAFQQSYAANPDLRLRFVGGDFGLQKNKLFRQELEAEAQAMGLSEVITFQDFMPDAELLIKSADILLNFSEAESFSMTVAEGSFYGIPVIATRCGGPEEIIDHEKTGLLVEKRNIRQMTAAILELAESLEKRKIFGLNGSEYVRTKFSASRFQNEFKKLLHD